MPLHSLLFKSPRRSTAVSVWRDREVESSLHRSTLREMCITRACADPTSPGVWWRDDAEWKQYGAAMAASILQGISNGDNRVELGTIVSSVHFFGAQYAVDLSSMKQINVASGVTRDVKVVSAPMTAVAATDPAATFPVRTTPSSDGGSDSEANSPVRTTSSSDGGSDDFASLTEEVRVCHETMKSVKEMVLKLQEDLSAKKSSREL